MRINRFALLAGVGLCAFAGSESGAPAMGGYQNFNNPNISTARTPDRHPIVTNANQCAPNVPSPVWGPNDELRGWTCRRESAN
jgi:hypothetical protein